MADQGYFHALRLDACDEIPELEIFLQIYVTKSACSRNVKLKVVSQDCALSLISLNGS